MIHMFLKMPNMHTYRKIDTSQLKHTYNRYNT